MPNRKKKKKANKETKNKKLPSALFLKNYKNFDFNLSEHFDGICAKKESTGIMKNAARTLLLFALGVANATEDQDTNGKHINPYVYNYTLNSSW